MAVTDMDVTTCYNMSLKDFKHSGVHDLFKVCKLFLFFLLLLLLLLLLYHVLLARQTSISVLTRLTHRPCPSSSLRPGKQLIWTRRGSCWRRNISNVCEIYIYFFFENGVCEIYLNRVCANF